ncbi:MAG: tRNA (cytidine(34)-2'-O)-methyltransferase, partial [Alphaproteobacteria bacterium]
MRLVLYQPDIPQNAGALMRLAACLRVPVDLIEPCGFVLGDRMFRRAALDYLEHVDLTRHISWEQYLRSRDEAGSGRLVLLSTKGDTVYTRYRFHPTDNLMVGRESAGVPDDVHALADGRVRIPMAAHLRSLNVAVAAGMVLGEALRQTGGLDG